jgi:membrane protein
MADRRRTPRSSRGDTPTDVARRPSLAPPLRLASAVARGFERHELSTRAAALTYATLFSLVPTLAVAFAMFKAFGGLDRATEVLLPKLLAYVAVGSQQVVEARIQEFIGNVQGGAIGGLGTVTLLLGVVSLMSAMEHALDRIWDVPVGRSFLQRATMYWTTVTVTPTLVLGGATLPATLGSIAPLAWLVESTAGHVLFAVVVPLVCVYGGFTLLYLLVPNTRVPLRVALIGGIAGGTLWWAAAYGYALYAAVAVTYSKIYGSLGALAIFLVWIYVSWLIVLLGAEVAIAAQQAARPEEGVEDRDLSPVARELLALRVMSGVAARFLTGRVPATAEELGAELRLPVGLVRRAVERLAAAGLLLVDVGQGGIAPARDPHRTSPADALAVLRRRGEAPAWAEGDAAVGVLEALGRRAEAAAHGVWGEVTFAELAAGRAPAA